VLFTWINPKGWMTTIGALAAYTTMRGEVLQRIAVIAGACRWSTTASDRRRLLQQYPPPADISGEPLLLA